MIKQLILIAWIGLAAVSLGCDGDKGDVGPAGPAGPAGAAGAKGDTGVAGKDALGAKVITTDSVLSDAGGYSFGVAASQDTAFFSTCGVFVYIKSNGWWYNIPGSVAFGDQSSTFNFRHALLNGRTFFVKIFPTSWSEQTDVAPERKFESIRIILVPTTQYGRLNSSVDFKDYNAVVKALGVKEKDFIKGVKY
ncbi:hypothetical protein [Dyadobacter sandarakinus]|uniref:Collagen-like protein n=1 Tax=Dyadobacter sandarakinus TaxID=2747268 RepID=A0ABX7IEF2_9BACT|nr:hypothetical protein [Dyadobacter sandarakinus]QRR03483.1 hypothetical protein HWI92_22500 [Dyadobacter sandarakinus]